MIPKEPFRNKYVGVQCKWPGCIHQARCHGYCVNHYQIYLKEIRRDEQAKLREPIKITFGE